MRKNKVRIWNGEKFIGPAKFKELLQNYPCPYEYGSIDDLIFQDFTGVHDSKGEEIYEGDILAIDGGESSEVYFEDGAFRIRHGYLCNLTNSVFRVIGNIFEKPLE